MDEYCEICRRYYHFEYNNGGYINCNHDRMGYDAYIKYFFWKKMEKIGRKICFECRRRCCNFCMRRSCEFTECEYCEVNYCESCHRMSIDAYDGHYCVHRCFQCLFCFIGSKCTLHHENKN